MALGLSFGFVAAGCTEAANQPFKAESDLATAAAALSADHGAGNGFDHGDADQTPGRSLPGERSL
jgi:hypothetical protein